MTYTFKGFRSSKFRTSSNFKFKSDNPQQLGKAGEKAAEWYLQSIGARCIEKIPTSIIVIDGKAIYNRKSSVDYTCALPNRDGTNGYYPCRIEVKVCDDNKLVHSRLKEHQVEWLIEYYNIGFNSFVLWVHKNNCYLIPYPNKLFKKGKSISLKDVE